MLSKLSQTEKDKYHVIFYVQSLDLKNEWQECKSGSVWGWIPTEGGGKNKRVKRMGEYSPTTLYTWKIEQWNLLKLFEEDVAMKSPYKTNIC
jgi:hypothetical protein